LIARASTLAREHPAFVAVMAVAVLVRAVVAAAYHPALMFRDSWGYVDVALRADPVGFGAHRPSGYPLVLNALSVFGKSLSWYTAVQHLAGLATGALVYALLLRHGVARGLAAAAAALVLLDAYAIVLEQHILAEAFFTTAIMASLYLVLHPERGWAALAASGTLLGLAATMRSVGVAAIPVWALYVAVTRRHAPRRIAAALVPVVLVLGGYAALHVRGDPTRPDNPKTFALSETDGWFLYSKVASFADCDGIDLPADQRPLCEPDGERRDEPDFYLYNLESPAHRHFGQGRSGPEHVADNELLRDFALTMIRHHPLDYADLMLGHGTQPFMPGAGGVDSTIELDDCDDCDSGGPTPVDEATRARYFADFEPPSRDPPALLSVYHDVLHTPRPLMGLFALMTLLVGVLALTPARRSLRHWPGVLLVGGTALAMMVAAAATANPLVRYLVPLVPLLTCAGVLAACDLLPAIRRRAAAR
jgi:4-amino-4-deoxy-L-arabinose transferase-like glycosyltransferase